MPPFGSGGALPVIAISAVIGLIGGAGGAFAFQSLGDSAVRSGSPVHGCLDAAAS